MSWGFLLLGAGQNDSGNVAKHNADAAAHPSILSQISEVKSRVLALEIALGIEELANPFAVTFGNLDGITVNAVWNADEARLEF